VSVGGGAVPSADDQILDDNTRNQQWWKRWWEIDYSWDGIARLTDDGTPRMPWVGWSVVPDRKRGEDTIVLSATTDKGRAATRQDHFRWDWQEKRLRGDDELLSAGLLIDVEGQPRFHAIHLPKQWRDGSESWKADLEHENWAALERETSCLLAGASPTATNIENGRPVIAGADGRAQLQGVTLREIRAAEIPTELNIDALHLIANFARFLRVSNMDSLVFGPEVSFERTVFEAGFWIQNAQFQGNAMFRQADFCGRTGIVESSFAGAASFARARFSHLANFMETTFEQNVSFSGAEFHGQAFFVKAILKSECDFSDIRFQRAGSFSFVDFSGEASFNRCTFRDLARFYGTKFKKRASFQECEFEGDAGFGTASFKNTASFKESKFHRDAEFRSAEFYASANFAGVRFKSDAHFTDTKFYGQASFWSAAFKDDAHFWGARFSTPIEPTQGEAPEDGSSSKAVGDQEASVGPDEHYCEFDFVVFEGSADFRETHFGKSVSFEHAVFHKATAFGEHPRRCRLEKKTRFEGKTNFRAATFLGPVDYRYCEFPTLSADRNGAFSGVRFTASVDFRDVEYLPFSMFDGAQIEQRILLSPADPKRAHFSRAIGDVKQALVSDKRERRQRRTFEKPSLWRRMWRRLPWTENPRPLPPDFELEYRGRDKRWGALEGGCRTLKRAMTQDGDVQREQHFYRYELIARRKRPARWLWSGHGTKASISPFEKLFSFLYGFFAGYGGAIARPLGSIFGSIVTFALIYWFWAALETQSLIVLADGNLASAFEFSLQNSFRPFGVWWPNFPGDAADWANEFKRGAGSAGWNWVRFVASLQSFFTIVMIFLTALSLRRRFQIS
jgi:uncharacterized protein YjbI with pentapeptide repeats